MATNRKTHTLTPDEVATAQQYVIDNNIPAPTPARMADRTVAGVCTTCGKPLYDGPLGLEHGRWMDDRDHAATPKAGA